MMGVAYRSLLFTVVLLGFLRTSFSQETLELHPKKENFDEALGCIAEGLILFHNHKAEGMFLLNEAVRLAPHTPRVIDTWLEHAESRIISETNLSNSRNDFERLRHYTLQCLLPIALKHPDATYLHLKLLEVCIELEKKNLAVTLAQQVVAEENDPYKLIMLLKLYQVTDLTKFNDLLISITQNSSLQSIFPLQKFTLECYIAHGDDILADSALKHSLNMIKNLPTWPKQQTARLCQLLNDGILTGSDIGRGAKDQLADNFYESTTLRYWSSLAAVLMKLEHFDHAHTILKHCVLINAERKWRAYLSMASCAYRMNKPALRLNYLEKASSIRPESRSIKRALAAAYLNSKKYAKTSQLLNELKPFDKDVRLKKIEYYLTVNQKNYSLAFLQAEALFNWPDPAERITTVSPGFASTSTQVYAQQGKLQLMLKRLQQARKYSPQSHNLKNSSAYFMAQHKLQLELAKKLSKESLLYMPKNPSYLDTLAWIKYQKNELDEAWELINEAIELDEKKSAEILMHAGDICLAMNGLFSESRAKDFWQKALQHTKNKDLIKRIKDKLKRQ